MAFYKITIFKCIEVKMKNLATKRFHAFVLGYCCLYDYDLHITSVLLPASQFMLA